MCFRWGLVTFWVIECCKCLGDLGEQWYVENLTIRLANMTGRGHPQLSSRTTFSDWATRVWPPIPANEDFRNPGISWFHFEYYCFEISRHSTNDVSMISMPIWWENKEMFNYSDLKFERQMCQRDDTNVFFQSYSVCRFRHLGHVLKYVALK